MLRIKKEIDLKELEKFGFEEVRVWGDAGWVYDFAPFKSSYLLIYPETKEIAFDYINFSSNIKCANLLYDLITAGYVEKVEE